MEGNKVSACRRQLAVAYMAVVILLLTGQRGAGAVPSTSTQPSTRCPDCRHPPPGPPLLPPPPPDSHLPTAGSGHPPLGPPLLPPPPPDSHLPTAGSGHPPPGPPLLPPPPPDSHLPTAGSGHPTPGPPLRPPPATASGYLLVTAAHGTATTVASVPYSGGSATASKSPKDAIDSPFTSDALSNETILWSQIAAAYYVYCNASCYTKFSSCMPFPSDCWHCFCDDACEVYGDCCPEEYAQLRRQPPSQRLDPEEVFTCSQSMFDGNTTKRYYMVSSCPSSTDRSLAVNCETEDTWHWTLSQPVTDRDSYRVYKNRYCARCHSATNLAPWPATIWAHDPSSLQNATSSAQLLQAAVENDRYNSIVYSSPEGLKGRECTTNWNHIPHTCNLTGEWLKYDAAVEKACGLMTYANPFCYLCNSHKSWAELLKPSGKVCSDGENPLPRVFILLDFYDADDDISDVSVLRSPSQQAVSPSRNCSSHMYFDHDQGVCRKVACVPGKRLAGSAGNQSCQSHPKSTNAYGYKICLYQNATANSFNVTRTRYESIRGVLREAFQNTTLLPHLVFDDFVKMHRLFYRETGGEVIHLYVFTLHVNRFSQSGRSRDDVDTAVLDLVSDLDTILAEVEGGGEIKLSPTCSVSVFQSLVGDDSRTRLVTGDSHNNFGNALYLVLSQILVCPYIELNTDEIRFDFTNLELISNDTSLSDGRYIPVPYFHITEANTTFVCLNKYRKRFPEPKSNKTEKIDTKQISSETTKVLLWLYLLCIMVSLVFLAASIVIYCLLPPLRTVAGVNNMVLIAALFWGQLFLQIGNGVKMVDWLCQVVGVATHLCWLMVTFAQNTCTFHMFYTLSFPLRSYAAMRNPGSLIKKYIAYVLLMPVVFVLVTLAWQFGANGDSGYGGNSCYITRMPVRLSMFAAPLFSTVVVNIVMFIFTIVRLRTLQKVDSTRSNKADLVLYLKLSLFVGVTWLIGFLYSFIGSLALAFIFAILQGCQGLLLFLAFLCKRRVLDMLVELTARWRAREAPTSSQPAGPSGTKTTTVTSNQAVAGTEVAVAVIKQ